MTHHSSDELTKEMRWQIAEKLAEDRLPEINNNLADVVVPESFYVKYGKRIFDFALSLPACIAFFPVNLIIGVITLIDVGRPLFFRQERTGFAGRTFTIVKFRNMRIAYDESGEMLPPSQRVTKWGRFVRRTSMDELLNFWSILKGDMSIIGPRPLPTEYLSRYHKRHKARLAVRPGLECPPLTPVTHVRTWQEQLDNDVWYVEHISLKTDIMMFFRLIQYTLDHKNATYRSEAGSRTFEGYNEEGIAITVEEIPQEYIDWAFLNTHREKDH